MAHRKAVTFLVIEKLTKSLPVTLDPDEREGLKDTIVSLADKLTALNREDESIKLDQREASRARKERIDETEASLRRTQDEHKHGTAEREFKCELRAVIATQSIDLVRLPDNDVVDTRPMNEDERLKYLQGSLLPDKDEPQTTLACSAGDLPAPTDSQPVAPDDIDPDLMPDDECDAVGVPHGWPRRWLGRSWAIEGSETPLTGADIAQVYLAISASGSAVDALCEHALCNWLSRPHIVRALALLLNQGLVVKDDEGKWFAAVEMPAPETEPGRKDTLPEAAVAPKPKRRGAKDTGEALLNSALEQSEAHH